MNSFMAFMDKYIVPIAGKIGSQRHLVAIRDAFVAMIPITMIGSFSVLINNLPSETYQNFMLNTFGENWKTLTGDLWWGSLGIMAIFLVLGIAYFLTKSYGENAIQSAMIALAAFFVLIPQVAQITNDAGVTVEGWGFIKLGYLGTTALFTSIVVGLVSTELFVRLSKIKQITIKMPDGVPPEVSRSFAKLIPGMLTLIILGAIGVLIKKLFAGQCLTDLLNTYLGIPLKGVADSLGGSVLIAFLIHLLWTFGLHGANIALPFTETLLMDMGAENAALAQAGATTGYHIMAGPFFDAFVYLGGSGMILGLLIALVIAGKRRKDMIALGLLPSLFNISEPVIFGLPIVLNPIFMIPFILAPMITTAVSYLSIKFGLVAPVIVAKIPWVTPPLFGGFLANGHWSGVLLAAVNLIISIVVYLPFVVASEKIYAKKQKEAGNN